MTKKPRSKASRAASKPKPPARKALPAKAAAKRPARPAADAEVLERIATALEGLATRLGDAPAKDASAALESAEAFIWHPEGRLAPVPKVSRVDLDLLQGIDRMRDTLIENTERFATGLPANNALLWGARGMGKSSLVKAAHAAVNARADVNGTLKLIEIHREDIESLPALMTQLRASRFRFIVFCDDLSFDGNDA
ncbi:DUF815 domain-containing protein, partial [Rhodopseudomonas sp. B29]|uniref:DUF815 domain-containing protein n=1 Tax=Rhodopseudomonas sp. B29 TaxID=95607 RepID=UPI0003B77BB3